MVIWVLIQEWQWGTMQSLHNQNDIVSTYHNIASKYGDLGGICFFLVKEFQPCIGFLDSFLSYCVFRHFFEWNAVHISYRMFGFCFITQWIQVINLLSLPANTIYYVYLPWNVYLLRYPQANCINVKSGLSQFSITFLSLCWKNKTGITRIWKQIKYWRLVKNIDKKKERTKDGLVYDSTSGSRLSWKNNFCICPKCAFFCVQLLSCQYFEKQGMN